MMMSLDNSINAMQPTAGGRSDARAIVPRRKRQDPTRPRKDRVDLARSATAPDAIQDAAGAEDETSGLDVTG